MAVIRLQVEVDSDVYPELYASLRAIERPESRDERLRQLAASGLVWEGVRMRGPPAAMNVPVLSDVVEAPASAGPRRLDDGAPEAAGESGPPLPPPLDAGIYRPGARSERVKRMRDRGLFKNG